MSGPGVAALRFRNGEPSPFPRSIAERVFNQGAIDSTTESDIIVWADGEAEIDLGPDDEIECVYCERFTSWTFLERLYALAAEVGLVILSDPHYFVTDPNLIHHLPEDFAEREPEVVASAKAMIEAMEWVWINPRDWDRIA